VHTPRSRLLPNAAQERKKKEKKRPKGFPNPHSAVFERFFQKVRRDHRRSGLIQNRRKKKNIPHKKNGSRRLTIQEWKVLMETVTEKPPNVFVATIGKRLASQGIGPFQLGKDP